MKKNKKKLIRKYICIVTLFLFIVGAYYFYNKSRINYKYLKVEKSLNLVYTVSEKKINNYMQFKPYVNLKGELGSVINQNIDEYFNAFSDGYFNITYDTDLNGKILSLIIKVEDYSIDLNSSSVLYFRSYNIDLDSLELLSSEKILSYFDLNQNDAEKLLNEKISDYYSKLLNDGKIGYECNYSCFLKERDFSDGINDVEYYVKDGKLVLFKPYIYVAYDGYDSNNDYGFEIAG